MAGHFETVGPFHTPKNLGQKTCQQHRHKPISFPPGTIQPKGNQQGQEETTHEVGDGPVEGECLVIFEFDHVPDAADGQKQEENDAQAE